MACVNGVCAERSPQSTSTAHGLSLAPGSLNEPRVKLWGTVAFVDWLAGAVTVGGTLLTVTARESSSEPPSPSETVTLGLCELGPSA